MPEFRLYRRELVRSWGNIEWDGHLRVDEAVALYQPRRDIGLIMLRLHRRTDEGMAELAVWTHHEGLVLVDPTAMSPRRLRSFVDDHLSRFKKMPNSFLEPINAVLALARAMSSLRDDVDTPPIGLARGTEGFPKLHPDTQPGVPAVITVPAPTRIRRPPHRERHSQPVSGVITSDPNEGTRVMHRYPRAETH